MSHVVHEQRLRLSEYACEELTPPAGAQLVNACNEKGSEGADTRLLTAYRGTAKKRRNGYAGAHGWVPCHVVHLAWTWYGMAGSG